MPEREYTFTVRLPVRKFWRVYLPAAIGISVGAMLLALFFIDVFIMPGIVGAGRGTVKVPTVQGLSLETGREKLFEAGLLTEIKSWEYNARFGDSVIISQVPAEGTKVKKGLRILVVVSKGREAGTVPDVKSLTERQARTELRKAGYTLGEVRKEFSDRVPADKVIDADPACGTAVSRETAIRLVISKGPHATSVEMPNIVGDAFDEAQKKIEAGGLHLGNVRYRSDPSLAANIVISQSIPPGERVPLETTVSVSVSKSE